jgi:cation:H+ antiporter
VDLALTAGVSEAAIGLTLVALGTSIPEYVTAVVASVRGRPDIAFGTVIGSNIFNILGIIGATAMVTPISIPAEIGIATWALFVASAALVLFFATTQSRLTRNEGLIMFALYLGYMCYLLA